MSTILFATDGSPSAARAGELALELARASSWALRIVAVAPTPTFNGYGAFGVAAVDAPAIVAAAREQAEKVVTESVERAAGAGVTATSEVRQGDPASEICDAAAEAGAALVVVGAHGWGAVRRLIFGSVSNRVLHEAACGVLVVRGEPEGE